MANVKPSAFGVPIVPAATTILMGETAGGVAGRFAASALSGAASPVQIIDAGPQFGVTAGGDSTTALMNMQLALAGSGKPHYEIHFPAGQVNYTNNRWLMNIKSFTLYAEGTTFLNTYSATFNSRLSQHLFFGSPFETNNLSYVGTTTLAGNYLLNASSFLATSVTTTSAPDAGNFAVGNRVLIHFFTDEFADNFPGCPRFWHFTEITSVNVGTGAIGIREAMPFVTYLDTFDFNSGSSPACGKPRIVNLDRSDYVHPRYAEIIGGRWLENTTNPTLSSLQVPGDYALIKNAYIQGYLWAGINKTAEFDGVTVTKDCEPDKIIDSLSIKRCWIGGRLVSAVGVRDMVVEDTTVVDYVNLSPRKGRFVNNRFNCLSTLPVFGLQTARATGTLEFIGNEWRWTTRPVAVIDLTSANSIALNGGSAGVMTFDDDATGKATIQRIQIGTLMWKTDFTKVGRVTRIGWDGSNFVVNGDWSETPANGETWEYCSILGATERGSTWPLGITRVFYQWFPHVLSGGTAAKPVTVTLTYETINDIGNETIPLKGYVTAARGRVLDTYGGSVVGVQAYVYEHPGFAGVLLLGLGTAGWAQSGVTGKYTSSVNHNVYDISPTLVHNQLYVGKTNGSSVVPTDDPPRFKIEIDLDPLG